MSKKVIASLVVVFCILLPLLTACTASKDGSNPIPEPVYPQKWEYKVVQIFDQATGPFYNPAAKYEAYSETGAYIDDSIDPDLQKKLDLLGLDGWELVGFTGEYPNVASIMIFKRLIQ